MKVGAAQFASEIADLDANMEIHLDWISRGRSKKLDLLVMPEVSLTGHYGATKLLDVAMRRSDERLQKLADAAGDMAVVVGFIEEARAAQFYNSAGVLQNGRLRHVHRKLNIPNYGKLEEGKYYAKGKSLDTYDLSSVWRAGILVCADAWDPIMANLVFQQAATLLISPISSGLDSVGPDFDNPGGWALVMRFYSMLYGAPSIMANRVGTEIDLTFWGGSRIVDPFGKEIAVAGSREELITAELDYEQVRRARFQLPTVRDSNLNLSHQEAKKIIGAYRSFAD